MKRLKRRLMKHGILIHDYIWILEWHGDGFPHWHFLVLVNKKGRSGRIANKIDLTETWGRAKFVKEGYIHDEIHWKRLVGYVAKHGYFGDGKKSQGMLPEWAKKLPKNGDNRIRIKRMERMRKDIRNGGKVARTSPKSVTLKDIEALLKAFNGSLYIEEAGDFEEVFVNKAISWGEYLASCGAKTLMTVSTKLFFLTMKISVSYNEIRSLTGEYQKAKGYIVELDKDQIIEFLKQGDEIVFYNRAEPEIDWDFEKWKKIKVSDEDYTSDQLNLPF